MRQFSMSIVFAVVAALAVPACGPRSAAARAQIQSLAATEDCFRDVAAVLAADAMEGRGVGTRGLDDAAGFLRTLFDSHGFGDARVDHLQSFDAIVGVELGDGNSLASHAGALALQDDFVPLGFSSSGAFEGDVVFAGYGIRAEELDYDDYAGLDVDGKVVLAMRFEPGEDDEDSPFDGRRPTHWSDLRYKAHVARESGAAALVLVDPPREGDDEATDKLPALKSMGPVSRAGLPVLQVTRRVADSWLAEAGTTVAEAAAEIARGYRPASRPLSGVRVQGQADLEPTTARLANVVGVLPGKGELAEEVVVVGAHYDHLGFGGQGSMRPDEHAIHNGADDNASGVAAMVCGLGELAERLDTSEVPRRTVVAIAFAAEEIGLGGSGWYTRNPLFPLESTVGMVNLDMVGRVRDDKLMALGTDSSPGWPALVEEAAASAALEVTMGGDGYGPSDQMSFYENDVPVVHLFSGAHDEYHTPADDVELLNLDGGRRVALLTSGLLHGLATRTDRIAYQAASSGPVMRGDSRGYGAYLGTIPDYTAMTATDGGGVLLGGVRPGGPADRGGIKGGDRIVELGGVRIENLYDMTFALREHRPGQTIDVIVDRAGQRVALRATLGDRRRDASPAAGDAHGAPSNDREGPGSPHGGGHG